MATSALVTEGVILKRGDGGGPEVFTAVAEVVDFDGPGGSATVIEATHLGSTAKDKLMGLPDEGQFSFSANLIPSDAEQTGLRTDRTNRTKRNFELLLTDAGPTKLSFAAFVLEFRIAGAVDDKISVNITLEITGAVTWS